MSSRAVAVIVAVAVCAAHASAFYLPGVAPRQFNLHDKVEMTVNKLTSAKTQLPYEYYSLPFCRPEKVRREGENLGETLAGDALKSSDYKLYMQETKYCNILCRRDYTEREMHKFADFIDDDYRVEWIVDNLPGAIRMVNEEDPGDIRYDRGYPLGQKYLTPDGSHSQHFLNNHVRLSILTHTDESYEGYRIVGFEVEPFSVRHSYVGHWDGDNTVLRTCNDAQPVDGSAPKQSVDGPGEVVFTYDVRWMDSPIRWGNRWDLYLKGNPDDQIHWFSIVNSLMIVLFLTGMVAMIMLRALRRDIARYNEDTTAEEEREETGWKLVHGDVFRPPQLSPMMLSVLTGSGVQVFMMTGTVMVFAVLGFLSPANRGGLTTAMLLLFVLMGAFAGYVSARLFKMFGGKAWKQNTVLTASVFPGFVFLVVFVLNFFVWAEASSGAIPFGTFLALILLWFGVSVPLVFLGAYYGYKAETVKPPVRVNQIPRQIPEQAWFLHPAFSCLVGGILPFGAVFIELFFIMTSLWLHQIYYVFGFLFIVLLILVATCAEITIVMCYFQLCNEDYRWWWRSFLTSGSSALYLFLYSLVYFSTKLEISRIVSSLLYFGYMSIITFAFFLLTGTIGFISCLVFVRTIYASIKVD